MPTTGDTIATDQAEADNKEQVLKALGQAASRLREKLGESLATIQKLDAPIEQVTTSEARGAAVLLARFAATFEWALPRRDSFLSARDRSRSAVRDRPRATGHLLSTT